MSIRPIIPGTDPRLRLSAAPFDFEAPPVDQVGVADDLIETMLAGDGLGLAAPQIGVPYRVVAIYRPGDFGEAIAMFNPRILHSEGRVVAEEGCLSFPGIRVKVARPHTVRVAWQDEDGTPHERDLDGPAARILAHEIDHLDGVTIDQRVQPLAWALARKTAAQARHRKGWAAHA